MAKKTQVVTKDLTDVVYSFCKSRFNRGGEKDNFHMDTLRKHVAKVVGKVAPDSPGRTLRQLRSYGAVQYTVLDRSKSLYGILGVY
jgi:hypothetical protein